MSRFPSWTAALPLTALLVGGCAERTTAPPSSVDAVRVCDGIPEARSRAFLADLRADVEKVETVREPTKTKPYVVHTVGADVYVRATPGMTAQWLARLTQCHLAREGCVASHDQYNSPFGGVAGTTIDISSTTTGFVVSMRSGDFVAAQEIVRRAHFLLGTASDKNGTDVRL